MSIITYPLDAFPSDCVWFQIPEMTALDQKEGLITGHPTFIAKLTKIDLTMMPSYSNRNANPLLDLLSALSLPSSTNVSARNLAASSTNDLNHSMNATAISSDQNRTTDEENTVEGPGNGNGDGSRTVGVSLPEVSMVMETVDGSTTVETGENNNNDGEENVEGNIKENLEANVEENVEANVEENVVVGEGDGNSNEKTNNSNREKQRRKGKNQKNSIQIGVCVSGHYGKLEDSVGYNAKGERKKRKWKRILGKVVAAEGAKKWKVHFDNGTEKIVLSYSLRLEEATGIEDDNRLEDVDQELLESEELEIDLEKEDEIGAPDVNGEVTQEEGVSEETYQERKGPHLTDGNGDN